MNDMRNMSRVEAFHILGEMMNNATVEQNEALTIAQYDIEFVDLMPDDMVHVVRCKDCKHFRRNLENDTYCDCVGGLTDPEEYDFCSYGERKDGEGK